MSRRQLPLHVRKAVAVRTAVALEIDGPAWPGQIDSAAFGERDNVRGELHMAADWSDDRDDDTSPLDEYLATVITRAQGLHARISDPEVVRRLDAFEARLHSIDCQACAKRAGVQGVCRAEASHDDAIVEHGGLCVATLRELQDAVETAIAQWLGDALGAPVQCTVHIHHDHVGANGNGGMLEHWALTAQTAVADTPGTRAAVVDVALKQKGFDWATLCQLPYVLIHELVCHAYQGIHAHGRRTVSSPCCAWSEGWMDAVAFAMYEHLPGKNVPLPSWWANNTFAVLEQGQAFHDRRFEVGAAGLSQANVTARQQARRLYRRFYEALDRALPPNAALEAAVRVSTSINAQMCDRRAYRKLLNNMHILLADPLSVKYAEFVRKSLLLNKKQLSAEKFLAEINNLARP